MTWPITDKIDEVLKFAHKAPCGCRYWIDPSCNCLNVSPYRMQRCFTHMKENQYVLNDIIKKSVA